jgi:hypothetical protein
MTIVMIKICIIIENNNIIIDDDNNINDIRGQISECGRK